MGRKKLTTFEFQTKYADIVAALRSGEHSSMASIGEMFNISRARVQQIAVCCNVKRVRTKRDTMIISLLEKGEHTTVEIAEIAKVTSSTVGVIARNAGVKNKHTYIPVEEVLKLRKEGFKFKEIAVKLFGTDDRWRTLQNICTEKKCTTPRSVTDERDVKMIEACDKGATCKEICQEFGVSKANWYRVKNKYSRTKKEVVEHE